ncbi:hypothetical protein V1290_004042 [Bradyrhizobium sp. AZCC 1578]
MIPPLKPGTKLLKVDGPVVETARLERLIGGN